MSYSRSDTVTILRSIHKVELRIGMTRGDIKTALDHVPAELQLTRIFEIDDDHIRLEFLEEKQEAPR